MKSFTVLEIDRALKTLNTELEFPWKSDRLKKINKTFIFANFSLAFSFMTQLALYAEKVDHHPEWSNVYQRVTITLTTHASNGLTQKDFDFAAKAERASAFFAVVKL